MKHFIFAIIVLFSCTSINMYEPKNKELDTEIYQIKAEVRQLYEQGKLSKEDINHLIQILE